MSDSEPILVTGAAGQVGGIGGRIVELLRAADTPVRALVRRDDERAARLRRLGAEVVVADLTQPDQVVRALEGCKRAYFGMGVSPSYLEATLVVAAAAREAGSFEFAGQHVTDDCLGDGSEAHDRVPAAAPALAL